MLRPPRSQNYLWQAPTADLDEIRRLMQQLTVSERLLLRRKWSGDASFFDALPDDVVVLILQRYMDTDFHDRRAEGHTVYATPGVFFASKRHLLLGLTLCNTQIPRARRIAHCNRVWDVISNKYIALHSEMSGTYDDDAHDP